VKRTPQFLSYVDRIWDLMEADIMRAMELQEDAGS